MTESSNIIRVVIADDHPMCREMARIAVEMCHFAAEITQVSALEEIFAGKRAYDLVILDLGLPDSRGIASLIDVVRHMPGTPVLVVSGSEAIDIESHIAAGGAVGFVTKAAPITSLIDAIRTVLGGERYFSEDLVTISADALPQKLALLTPAESRVLRAMSGGRLNKQIAHDLGLSEITVKQHVKAILRKLNVSNRTQAILAAHSIQA